MKTPALLLALALWAQYSFAQSPDAPAKSDPAKVREIGLYVFDLDNFGLTYRWGHDRAVWRLQTARVRLRMSDRFSYYNTAGVRNANLQIGIAREWRKPLTERMDLRLGAGLGIELEHSWGGADGQVNRGYGIAPAANFIFGLNYRFKERFIIGAEIDPQLSYEFFGNTNIQGGTIVRSSVQEISVNAGNKVALSFCVRF